MPHHLIAVDVDRFPADVAAASRRPPRPIDAGEARPTSLPVECVARGYLSGSGWKEYSRTGAVCGIALPPGLQRVRPAARADLHAGDQGGDRPRREHQRSRRPARSSATTLTARLRDLTLAIYAARRRVRRDARHHHRRHEVRVRRWPDGELDPDRRSADARLVALLAAGPVRAGQERSQLRQAVRARLSRGDRLEQTAAGAFAAGRGGRDARGTSTVEAYRLLTGRELAV